MARLTNPLMSIDGSGTIAGQITTQKWKGRSYFRKKPNAKPSHSAATSYNRAWSGFFAAAWKAEPSIHPLWEPLAANRNITPYNAFVGFNLARIAQQLGPTADPTPTPPVGSPGLSYNGYTIHNGNITFGYRTDGTPNPWCTAIQLANSSAAFLEYPLWTATGLTPAGPVNTPGTIIMKNVAPGFYISSILFSIDPSGAIIGWDDAGPITIP